MRKLILLPFLFLILFSFGCTVNDDTNNEDSVKDEEIKRLENKIEALEHQISDLETEIEVIETEKSKGKEFINNAITLISQDELYAIAALDWEYSLMADEYPISDDGSVLINKNSFSITVSEAKNPFSILPVDISNLGKVSGSLFSNHIQFPDRKPSNTAGSEDEYISSTTYIFENLYNGEQIKIQLSTELKERLELESEIVSIKVFIDESLEDDTIRQQPK
ncbi:hypothetical protein [Alkalibacter mobilis]|uniref:hypothetical protein n=1 Tax=Alkalibacter mobilis TaxID=2787712 RepID=UPI00189FAED5|nr:hypothetical protein [Alkalibacter mobilis]MBF7095946.1 hypothetical protein [Alkalibacter mobilis]